MMGGFTSCVYAMNPVVYLLSTLIWWINIALFVWVVLSLLISFNVVNRWHPVVSRMYETLSKLLEPLLRPIRRILPDLGGIDISPIILIIVLNFIEQSLYYYL